MNTYQEKLQHPKWQKKRLEILKRDSFQCRLCKDGETTLHIHHLKYINGNDPWQYKNSDLMTVCKNCHEMIHACHETKIPFNPLQTISYKVLFDQDVFTVFSIDKNTKELIFFKSENNGNTIFMFSHTNSKNITNFLKKNLLEVLNETN